MARLGRSFPLNRFKPPRSAASTGPQQLTPNAAAQSAAAATVSVPAQLTPSSSATSGASAGITIPSPPGQPVGPSGSAVIKVSAAAYAPALPNVSGVTLLGNSVSFEEIPIDETTITSPDLVSGTWTARLGDAGTWQVQFPNGVSSDGEPWLTRFSAAGRNDWLEIKHAGYLEFVGCVESVKADYQSITVSGHDAFWLLKSQYERDWQCLQAPRDVMWHATQVAVPVLADTFQETAINTATWTTFTAGGTLTPTSTGLVFSGPPNTSNIQAQITSVVSLAVGGKWELSFACSTTQIGTPGYEFSVTFGPIELLLLWAGGAAPVARLFGAAGLAAETPLTPLPAATFSVVLESDGRWVRAYVQGQLVGYVGLQSSDLATTAPIVFFNDASAALSSTLASTMTLSDLVFDEQKQFLMAGADQGDYVLPGSAATFPNGGIHARYYNDLASVGAGTGTYLATVLAPIKDNPASGQPSPYDVVIPQVNGDSPGAHVTSGFGATNWSVKYFGSIWLPLAQGNVPMSVSVFSGSHVRVWIGKTQFGARLVDEWPASGGNANYAFTVSAAALANGAGVVESGWYPIVVEYAAVTATEGPILYFGVVGGANLPFGWTDPGGTVLTSGEAALAVPATSLSPLGCVDQRYQGVSYFDMYQQTGNAYAYQFTPQPKQLESGVFPANLCPRVREGHDTDEILKADLVDSVSPIINYSNTIDATDQVSSMFAIGAGINDGLGSQLQARVFAFSNLLANLFDLQGWLDASDVSYLQLLAQRAAAQLALQELPWQNLAGDPRATDRLADTFPVTGVLAEFHWRPGDGVRFWLPDIGVEDTATRQMTQVTRTFGRSGRTASSMQPGISGNLLKRG